MADVPNVLIVYTTVINPTLEDEAIVASIYPRASKSYPGLFTLTANIDEVRKAFEAYPQWTVSENGIATTC